MKSVVSFEKKEYSNYPLANNSSIWVSGCIFQHDRKLTQSDLAQHIYSNLLNSRSDNWNFNGFFSFCYEDDNQIVIGVDHIRTMSIFYGIDMYRKRVIVSDNANLIKDTLELSISEMDKFSLDEFILTGYVTRDRTLFNEIKQVLGGECIYINKKNGIVSKQNIFEFKHNNADSFDLEQIKIKHDRVLKNVMYRLIDFAAGRQIVVPLSAGHDSLLLLLLLKKYNYDNVLAFTYGRKNNKEALISEQRAKKLGVKWVFIEYNESNWIEEWQSETAIDFVNYAMNLSSLPHIQDYIAVKKMKENQELQVDAIFVPGHCPIGVTMPPGTYDNTPKSLNRLVQFIFDYHYCNNSILRKRKSKAIKKYLHEYFERLNFSPTNKSFMSMIELWQWYEREPKYIGNSIKNYTFFSYNYWFPLWDLEYLEFCLRMPLVLLEDRRWYEWYIEQLYGEIVNSELWSPYKLSYPKNKDKKNRIINLIKRTFIGDLIKRLIIYKAIKKHPLAFDSIYSRHELFWHTIKGNHILEKYIKLFLKYIK